MKKGFVICWYYPPGNSSEGLVTFKLLSNSKYSYDVWTRENQQQSVWDRKSDEDKLTASNINVIKDDCDGMKQWVRDGLRYFEEHKDEYDFIMSRSMPVESHELAMKIKEKYPNIKWIASFGDPIIDTPYIDEITMGGQSNPFKFKEYLKREEVSALRAARVLVSPSRSARKLLWRHEKKDGNKTAKYFEKVNFTTVSKADVLIYNNEYQLAHAFSRKALARFKDKSVVLEHSYDTKMYPNENKVTKNEKISFIYVGHLDDTRNARSLLKAINRLQKKDKELEKRVRFDFYGHLSDSDKIYIVNHGLMNVVKVHDDVKYLKSLEIIKNADWAILIDANFTSLVDDCIYLPAKLIDYIGARTRVFSISHVKGAGSDIIRKVGGGKVVTHSPDDIYLYLSKIIYQKFEPKPYDEKRANYYSSKTIAKRLDEIEDKLLGED